MDEKSVKRFFIFSCIVAVFLGVFLYEFKYFTDFSIFKKKHFLVIGILSAPENFQQRLSIRKTWLQLLSDISASVYFIIGSKICQVPPYDRADPYTCVDKPFVLSENATELTEFTTMKIQRVNSRHRTFIGFSFHVRSSIIVKKLGILKQLLLLSNKEIQVKLISAFDNEVLASVTFNSELVSNNNSTVLTKVIKPVLLDDNFEGVLKLVINDPNIFFPECSFISWENKPYVINYIQLWQEGSAIPQPFDENSCTFIFMTYTVKDAENIKLQMNNKTLRLKEWEEFSKKLDFDLKNEIKKYNDIFLVDVVDVYRNLSMKLMHFYKRIVNLEYFNYILKADDDSFIDVLRVYKHLKQSDEESSNKMTLGEIIKKTKNYWWWSYFKQFWKVERSGKWREDLYQSVSYPTFPCGGGYVLNKMVIDYITENKNLHHFQGEDVSLGIWLSTLPVTQYKTPRVITKNELQEEIITKFQGKQYWEYFKKNNTIASNLCEWTCDNIKNNDIPLCNKVQLSVLNMYVVWKKYIEKGFL